MTKEEKAKAYDEALKKIRTLYEQAKKDDNPIWSTYEYLFPQLQESDDERIRKWIIEEFKLHYDFESKSLNPMVKKAIAWLEKQKEPTEELSTRLNGLMQEYVKYGKDEEEQEHRLKCYQLFWDALGDSEFFNQKEQKPVVTHGETYHVDTLGTQQVIAGKMPQKPTEKLSKEEYVKKFKALCDAYEIKLPNREYDIYGLCEDLHKLFGREPFIKEWSEEDETHRDFILESLEDQIRFYKYYDAEGTYYTKQIRTAQNWLKSLPLNLKRRMRM